MKRHIDRVHKPFKCQLCKKCFSAESELESHTPTCTGPETEFQCPECGNTFASKANLKRHMEIHSGAEPKQCPQCNKTFRNEKLLQKHEVVHSDERAFACPRCDKAFRRAEDLVKHTRTHTGEAPYKCRLLPSNGFFNMDVRLHAEGGLELCLYKFVVIFTKHKIFKVFCLQEI